MHEVGKERRMAEMSVSAEWKTGDFYFAMSHFLLIQCCFAMSSVHIKESKFRNGAQ